MGKRLILIMIINSFGFVISGWRWCGVSVVSRILRGDQSNVTIWSIRLTAFGIRLYIYLGSLCRIAQPSILLEVGRLTQFGIKNLFSEID